MFLSPQQWFINALVDLFEQESEYVIDVLEDCRFELGRTAETYLGEAEQLRAASRMLGKVVGCSVVMLDKVVGCSVVCVVWSMVGKVVGCSVVMLGKVVGCIIVMLGKVVGCIVVMLGKIVGCSVVCAVCSMLGKVVGCSVIMLGKVCLLYTSPSPRDISGSRMTSSA